MHPCRKLVINDTDKKIFELLKESGSLSIEELYQKLSPIDKRQLKKRLEQLKRHKLIACDSKLKHYHLLEDR